LPDGSTAWVCADLSAKWDDESFTLKRPAAA
jgi:hypothetical protein